MPIVLLMAIVTMKKEDTMAKPEIFRKPLSKTAVRRLAKDGFGDMIKFVIDLDRKIICAGGGLHADAEAILLEDGSSQTDLWVANYYPDLDGGDRFIYRSMINIRPNDGNTQQQIQSDKIRQQVRELALHFFEGRTG
jgi:hypothetical protein